MLISCVIDDNRLKFNILGLKISFKLKKSEKQSNEILIGDFSYSGAKFISPNAKIGKYCSIGIGSMVGCDVHPTNYITTSPKLISKYYEHDSTVRFPDIEVGNDVWIGANAIILPKGGKIGTGAIIGAGAVVTKDVPPYAIVAGIPAKIIKYRYDNEIIEKLLASKWWDIPHDKLSELDLKT